jgi:PAS domain S-box-containing protein
MSSSVLQNVIHPRQTSPQTAPLADDVSIPNNGDALETPEADMGQVLGVLVENAPVAMAMFDHRMRYILANRAWVEEFGLSAMQPLAGRSQYEVFPSLHPGWRQVYDRALQGHVVRSEHDALASENGSKLVYRWEVRPWRRHANAMVGGLMIICERFVRQMAAPAAADEPVELTGGSVSAQAAQKEKAVELALPVVHLDQAGVVVHANPSAARLSLAKGLVEGISAFWEVFGGGGSGSLKLKQQLLSCFEGFKDEEGSEPVILQVPPAGDGNAMWVGGADTSMPTRWLLARQEGAGVQGYVAMALPAEPVQTPPATPPNLSAIANAVAAIAQPPTQEAGSASGGLELRRLQDDLARARQELRTLHEAERTFSQRETRLRGYLDTLPFGILVLDELGAVLFQSQQLTRLLGRPVRPDENVEQWLAAACPNEHHREQVASLWREDVWRRQLTRVFTLATADGLLKDLEFSPASLAGGGVIVCIQDATEKCRHEEQLRATEAKFRALLHESPLPVVLMDKAGSVFEVNPAAEQIFGQPKSEMRRHPLERCFASESAAAFAEARKDLLLGGARQATLGVRVVPAGAGPSVSTRLHMAQVMDAEGEPHCTIHFFEKLETPVIVPVIEPGTVFMPMNSGPASPPSISSPGAQSEVLLFKTNVNGRIKECRERGLDLLGLAMEEALGRPLHQFFRPSDATGFYTDLKAYAQEPDQRHGLVCFSHTGVRHPLRVRVEALGGGGLDFAVLEVFETVLESCVQDGTPVLAVLEQPAAAQSPLINLAREKLLLSETHHRIKNHLQIISSLLNLESNTIADPAARNALRSSQNRVRSIADLHQHLYQSVLGTCESFLDFAEVLLGRLRECYDVSAERVPVHLDLEGVEIQQEWLMPLALTLNETVSNCFEHAFPGGREGEVHVSLHQTGATGELIVSDNGVGLTEGLRPGSGSGLGLKILAVFAEQMRGKLLFSRPEGGGTEIRLKFPVSAVE